ncbi:hypothetical protein KAR91_40985, partial [Candidatus Pacearchaeota archaeon]|nr:hypothetical protein [Candidatus Pacearchaeota archaeon]
MAATDATRAPKDFADLVGDLVNRIRAQTGITATEDQAKRYINLGLHDMHIGTAYKFPWAERRAYLRTHEAYMTGTVAITQGDTALEGTSTAWATANAFAENNTRVGGKVIVAGSPEVYEVETVTDDDSIVLSEKFIGPTVTAAEYAYFEDEYALEADFLRFVDMRRFCCDGGTAGGHGGNIEIVSRTKFRRRYPSNDIRGRPTVATIIDKPFSGNATRVRKARLKRAPDLAYMLPYDYITSDLAVSSAGAAQASLSADADEPIVPWNYRSAITYFALYTWYRDKKDDKGRSDDAKAEYNKIMTRILSDQE